jgi:hypothetical protein
MMSTVSKLQYGSRFGEDVAKIAKSPLSVASSASEAMVATARYTRWFHGDDEQPEPLSTSIRKFRPLTPEMLAAEVAAVTKDNLAILGEDASELFTARLPVGHRLRKSVRSSILPRVPYLGACKFGEILTDRSDDKLGVTQIFITNFDTELDTRDPANFYKPISRDFDQVIFGVHMIVDREGRPLGFNMDRGRDGVAFRTKDITEALYQIASASTGLSIQELAARARNGKAGSK